jgi:hypothetical protein
MSDGEQGRGRFTHPEEPRGTGLKSGGRELEKPLAGQWLAQNPMGL